MNLLHLVYLLTVCLDDPLSANAGDLVLGNVIVFLLWRRKSTNIVLSFEFIEGSAQSRFITLTAAAYTDLLYV